MNHWMISKMMIDARYQVLLHEANEERLVKSRSRRDARPSQQADRSVRPAATFEACCQDQASAA